MGIPAGWYQDLADAGRLRWWDGDAWTSATREREALDGPPAGPSERLTAVDAPAVSTARTDARPAGPAAPSTAAPDTAHLTSAAAAVAAAEAAARLSVAGPAAESARGLAPDAARGPAREPMLESAPARSPRTVRIDDRELGHLLDVVPEVPPHLLPLPPERPVRPRRAGRTGRSLRSERPEPAGRVAAGAGGDAPITSDQDDRARPRGQVGAAAVPHVTLASLGRSAGRGRVSIGRPNRAPRVPLGRRAALRRTVATGGAVALVVVLAVGFLLDSATDSPVVAPLGTEDAPVVDPLLDEIPVVPELGAPGADGGPEGEAEAEAPRRVRLPLGGPCGTQEVEVPAGGDPTNLRAWDAPACALAPVALAAGEERWIVVRASLDGSGATEASARVSVERADADGLLWSSYYASLNPDLWVVFDGPFASRTEAEAAARTVGGGAYERVLSDDEGDRYCIAPGGCTGGNPRD